MAFIFAAIAFFLIYFLCSWAVVFFLKPKVPRKYFLYFLVFFGVAYILTTLNVLAPGDEPGWSAWFAGLVLYVTACFTMWNSFYSILWGFSGGLLADFCSQENLREFRAILRSYTGDPDDTTSMDRMLKRRIPGLENGNMIRLENGAYKIQPKGAFLALVTMFLYRFFSLGKGGGIHDEEQG